MKKNYQGYIDHESENFGQIVNSLFHKCATEESSVYQVCIKSRYKLSNFLQNSLTKIYKPGLEMKKSYQGYIEFKNFGQILNSFHPDVP